MKGLPWLLAATALAARVHCHQLQRPLRPEAVHNHREELPPPDDVDDSRYDALFALHKNLVNINSISGHEHAVGIYLEQYLKTLNYTVERQNVGPLVRSTAASRCPNSPDLPESLPQRFNLLAHPPGHRRTPILLTTHIDTVPPFYPYTLRTDASPEPHNPQLWGRGTVDAKACIATQLFAAQSLFHDNPSSIPPNSLSHLFVVGEEAGGDGMKTANSLDLAWDTVIFGEPTELKLASGHKGILIFRLRAHGQAAHSGYPWLGASATRMLVQALAKLDAMPLPWSDKYGNSTVNIGTIEGGVAANVMAENATASVGIRIAEGSADVVRRLVLETVKAVDERIEVRFTGEGYGPVELDHDVPGFESMTVNYGTDVPLLHGEHTRYLYGPGSIFVAHGDHEHLGKKDMIEAVHGYERIILHALRKGKKGAEL